MLPPPRQPSNRDILVAIAKLATKDEVAAVQVDLGLKLAELRGHVMARLESQDEDLSGARREVAEHKKEILSWKTKSLAIAAGLGPLAIAGAAKAAEWLKDH